MTKNAVFGLEEFNKFLEEELKPAVLEFNGACGKDPSKVDDIYDASEMILNECKRVIEECEETVAAYKARDAKERLDGVVDVYWTSIQLQHLLDTFMVKFPDIIQFMKENFEYDEVLQLSYALGFFQLAITLGQGTIISGHRIALAGRRIVANNKQKYTTNLDEALDWEKQRPAGVILRNYTFNGQEFYCLKRVEDDYIVKPYTFKDVKLGDLV
ncbi:hypothetical protein vBAbaMD22_71 [Acinetobacter phage vB_AbaM_D22]|nr:hypothetical protein vBAbaMD22_71 [Acinetobacter phage vB_AbaM_D22]